MKTTEVVFKRNYAISPLTMEHMHLQVTVAVEDGESTADALKYAQDQVESFYKDACEKSQTSMYDSIKDKLFDQPIYLTKKYDTPAVSLMEELELVEDLEVLKSYRFTVKTDAEKEYYENKIEFLTKK